MILYVINRVAVLAIGNRLNVGIMSIRKNVVAAAIYTDAEYVEVVIRAALRLNPELLPTGR